LTPKAGAPITTNADTQSDAKLRSAAGGYWVVGADVPKSLPRKAVTLWVNTDGVGHVWLKGEQTSLAISFGPIPEGKAFTIDSTIIYKKKPPSESISFYATDAMIDAMAKEATSVDAKKRYNIVFRNCTTEALRVLKAGGIVFPEASNTWVPAELARNIKAFKSHHPLKGARVYSPPTAADWKHNLLNKPGR
jgi:hypothetical protein